MAIAKKFAKSKGLTYNKRGPLFVNSKMKHFIDGSRSLNWFLASEIAGVSKLTSHVPRKMFATYVGSSPSLILRQCGALAASHRYKLKVTKFRTLVLLIFLVLKCSKIHILPII